MNKKIIAVICGLLLSAVLIFGVVPVAATGSTTTSTPLATQTGGKAQLLLRILSVPTLTQLETLKPPPKPMGKSPQPRLPISRPSGRTSTCSLLRL